MQVMNRDPYAFGDDGFEDDEDAGPSKSEIKRQMLALQDLGRELTKLSDEKLDQIPLDDGIRAAVREYRRIKTFKAQLRHIQHLGKLLRQVDADAVRKALDDAGGASAAMVALQHRCERLRDGLIASNEGLTEFIEEHPGVDLQKLRQCIRAARKEAQKEDPAKRNPKASREIYRILREAILEKQAASAEEPTEGDEE